MARYIDADEVKLKVQRYLIPNTDVDGTVDCEVAERWFLNLLDEAVTADVVPKSEVEALQEMLDATIAGQETLQKSLANAKTEVAREIFAEIERAIGKRLQIDDHMQTYGQDSSISYKTLAKLKKKYTEGNDG